jgi:hypothetical protein
MPKDGRGACDRRIGSCNIASKACLAAVEVRCCRKSSSQRVVVLLLCMDIRGCFERHSVTATGQGRWPCTRWKRTKA